MANKNWKVERIHKILASSSRFYQSNLPGIFRHVRTCFTTKLYWSEYQLVLFEIEKITIQIYLHFSFLKIRMEKKSWILEKKNWHSGRSEKEEEEQQKKTYHALTNFIFRSKNSLFFRQWKNELWRVGHLFRKSSVPSPY